MRRFGSFLVLFFIVACSPQPPAVLCGITQPCEAGQSCVDGLCAASCGPANCAGCCSSITNACELGSQASACGLGGAQCQACASCNNAVCVGPIVDGGTDAGTDPDAGTTDAGRTDGGLDAGKPDAGLMINCFDDTDCPNVQLFFCNTNTSLCEASCRVKADCTAAVRGQFSLPTCDNNPLGCNCDEGQCREALCSADSDCAATQVCRNGACVAPPVVSTIASCEVVPGFVAMAAGSKAKFAVLARDAMGNPVVPKTGYVWSAPNGFVAGSGTGPTQEFTSVASPTTAGPGIGVQVDLGTVSCTAEVLVHRAILPADTIDVVAIDELSGRPVSGASVLLSVPATGAAIGTAGTTDALGRTTFTTAAASVTVSVFHADFDYLTIGGYAAQVGSRSVIAPLRRNPLDRLGGIKGVFTNVPATSNVHLGSAGVGQASFFEPRLLAPAIPTRVKIGTAIDQMDVPLAAASTMGFASQLIKDQYSVPALNGTCRTAGGAVDTAQVALGACGSGTAFGLTIDVPLGDLPIDAISGGTNNIDWSKLLARAQPLYRKFNSSLVRDVQYARAPTQIADGGWALGETSGHTVTNLPFGQLPLGFAFVVRSPDLPAFRGRFAQMVLSRGVAIVPGRGLVELGLGSAANTNPADTKTDTQSGLLPGLMTMRMAPTHHGLEGSEYAIVSTAISGGDPGLALEGSSLVTRVSQLRFDPAGTMPLAFPFPPVGYLGYPEGARYNFTDTAQGALPPRSFRFTTTPIVPAATMVRVTFTDRLGRRWVALTSPIQPGFTLPKPPGALPDRTFTDGASTGARSLLRVDGVTLLDGTPVEFRRWNEVGSGNPSRALDFTMATSFIDYQRPSVMWLAPAASGTTVLKGGLIVVRVGHFRVGTTAADDGFVRLSFAGGTGCASVDASFDSSMGKNEIGFVVPATCTGTNVQMTAQLHEQSGVAVLPAVSDTITVSIQ